MLFSGIAAAVGIGVAEVQAVEQCASASRDGRRAPRQEDATDNQRSNENNRDCNNPAVALLLSNHWRRGFPRLPKLLRHLGVAEVFGVEIDH